MEFKLVGKPEWRGPGLSLALEKAAEQRIGRFHWKGSLPISQRQQYGDNEQTACGMAALLNFSSFPHYSPPQIPLKSGCPFHLKLKREEYFLKKSRNLDARGQVPQKDYCNPESSLLYIDIGVSGRWGWCRLPVPTLTP